MSFHYTAAQLLRYLAHAKAHPYARMLPPGGRAGWDDMSAADWLAWFRECLGAKINRQTEAKGRKHDPLWQLEVARLAQRVNSRLLVRPHDVPREFRQQLAHRITRPEEE